MANTLVYISGNDPSRGLGGHSCFVRMMAHAATALGYEPHIFCVAPEPQVTKVDYGVIHRVATPWRPFRHNMMPLNAGWLARGIVDFLSQKEGPHLMHGFFVWSYPGVLAARKLREKGVKSVVLTSTYDLLVNEVRGKVEGMDASSHSLLFRFQQHFEWWWMKSIIDPREEHAYRNSARVFVNYNSVKNLISSAYGFDDNIRKIPYTTETAMSPEPKEVPETVQRFRAANVPLIVTVSRHDPRKGLTVFLRALASLREKGVVFRCCMVGGGELLEAHRKLCTKLGLDDVVSIEGFVQNSYAYLKHADIFALPSNEEGSGSLSMLEALQAGVAVIACGVDGIPEDVTDGEDALLVPPADEQALAGALEKLIRDVPLRQKLAGAGKRTFEEKFSPAILEKALEKNYTELGFPAPANISA